MLIVGRGGAGKSTLAKALGLLMEVPVIELDKHFWQPGLRPLTPEDWTVVQQGLAAQPGWVMDGDLGPYDVLSGRLSHADTVILLDYGFVVCAWRAARRSREGRNFWLWVWHYRRRHLEGVLSAVAEHAPGVTVFRLRSPRATRAWLRALTSEGG